jgi:hypothetical protein
MKTDRLFDGITSATARIALVGAFAMALSLMAQELQITSPADGAVVRSGQTFGVTVDATPGGFQAVVLIGQSPLGYNQALTSPPYQFSVQILSDIASGACTLTAVGIVEPGVRVYSRPITVDIERPDTPQRISAQGAVLTFHDIGSDLPLIVTGAFPDGSSVNLTRSKLTTYGSDSPGVAVVDNNGIVTAMGPGSANIAITNAGASIEVSVVVPATGDRCPRPRLPLHV